MTNKFISETTAILAVLSLLVFSLPITAQGQEIAPISNDAIDVSDISSLPENIQAILGPALESGDEVAVAAAVRLAILANPNVAVAIIRIAVRRIPAAAALIAQSATTAVFEANQSSGDAVLEIVKEIVAIVPTLVTEVTVAVFQALPEALQHQANLDVMASTSAIAASVPLGDVTQSLGPLLPTVLPPELITTPIFIEIPVSAT